MRFCLIKQDAEFESYAEFIAAFRAWLGRSESGYRIAYSEALREKDIRKNNKFKYRSILYNCLHYGEPQETGPRPSLSYLATGCCAAVRVVYLPGKDCLKIVKMHTEHTGHSKVAEEVQQQMRTLESTQVAKNPSIPLAVTKPLGPAKNVGSILQSSIVSNDVGALKTTAVVSKPQPVDGRKVAEANPTLVTRKRKIDYNDLTLDFDAMHKKQSTLVKKLEAENQRVVDVLNAKRERRGLPEFNPPPINIHSLEFFWKLNEEKVMNLELQNEMDRLTKRFVKQKLAQIEVVVKKDEFDD